ncbi:MAG: YggS family pyridoxal phosphate-dependent enzyme [Holophaga sp.]|nr:YggS family pyridoxal phosphate-dependent enzyme [Holophaga sp.]
MTDLAERVQTLRTRIRRACEASDRDPQRIELLPVSKRQSVALIQEAARLGFGRFGENYVQEGLQKAQEAPALQFVLIGPLQRNKAKHALTHFQEIMTVDRPELAERLRHLAQELDLVRGVWIQVDLWGEATKLGGCSAADTEAVFQALAGDPRLPVRGFMAIPPPEDAQAFPAMAAFRNAWQQKLGQPLRLSMGMSGDLERAIAAGSDQVRIGTAFFGNR